MTFELFFSFWEGEEMSRPEIHPPENMPLAVSVIPKNF
jgi:hypothetical protein